METNKELLAGIRENLKNKQEFLEEIKTYLLSSNLKLLEVSNKTHSEYLEGIFIKDITSKEQFELGITILHIIAEQDTDFSLHFHNKQSQTISVIAGKILDLENNIEFEVGESFFVSKNKNHRLRYFKDTQLIVVYMPQLSEIK